MQCTNKEAQFTFLAKDILQTINLNQDNIKKWAILDSRATSHFLVVDAPCDDARPALT